MDFRQFELLARQPSAALRERRTFWGLSKRALALLLANMMFWQPLVAMADGVVPNGPGTSVGQAGNGVPIVNIAAPNGGGLSHNTFNDYNVGQQGLILNNATDRTQATQLGGIILGNPNLNGRSANVILNEVNGGSPSQLRGYTEVAGQSAHVIVANPYGVTCNGCGFINTPKATLTTGKPVIEHGQLQRYQVEQGSVAIEGAGLNASNIDQFEIITRSAKVNAQIQAKHLAMVTGANDVDARTLDATARTANPENAPQLAIDASALGGMYANTIKLVGTEAGVGVKLDGQMIASGGDMQIDANGQLRMAEASAAKGSMAINAASLDAQGAVYAGKELKVRTQGDLTNRTSLSAGERVDLASGARLTNQGVIEAGVNADNSRNANGDLQITAQHLDNRGKNLLASGTLNATVTQALDNQGGTLSGQRQVTVNAGSLDNRNKGKLASSSGSVEATVSGELRNSGGGTLVSQQTLSAKAAKLDNSDGGILSSAGEQHLVVSDLLNNAQGGLIDSGAALTLNAMTLGNAGGGINAVEALRITAHSLDNSGGKLAGKGEVNLTLLGALTNTQGKLSSAGPLRLEGSAAVSNHGGQIVSDGLMSLFASSLVNTQGTLQSQGLLSLNTGDITNDGGRITAQAGDVHITAGNVDNREGGLYAKGLVKVSANDFGNSGQVAGQQVDFDLSGALNNRQGIIESDSSLAIKAASLDNQAGQLRTLGRTGNTRFAIGGLLDNRSGTLESASHDLGLGAGSFLNAGGSLLHVGLGTFDIATGTVTGAGGSIVTHGSLALNADSWSNSSVIQAGRLTVNVGNFSQTAAGQLLAGQALLGSGGTWVNDGLIASDGSLSLDLDGGYSGNGRLSSRDTLGLSASQLTLGSAASLAGGADTSVQVAGQLNNAGRITTAGNLGLSAAGVHNQGTLGATGNFTLGTGALSNERGLLFSGRDMALRVNSLTNSYADVYSLGSLTIDRDGQGGLASSIVNRSGSLQSDGAMSLAAASIQNLRAVLETSDQGAYTARISEVACIEGYNAGDCSGKRNHVWEIVQRDKFEVTEASAASSITTGSHLTIKGGELLNSSSTIAAAGNLLVTVDNLTNSGVQTGETETTRIFMSARTRNGGAWYDAANAFNSQYWFQNPGYNPNNLAGLQGAMAGFIGMTETEWVSLGSRRTLAVGDQRYAGVIQAGGTVSINAANGIDNSVVRPGYSYIGSGARTDTSAPGTAFSTRISLNQQLPPDLAQQQLNPLALPDFTLPEGQNGLFRLTGDSANAVIGSGIGSSSHKYLIETNPALTDLKQFMSSDYLLANLGYDPDDSAKRLGDGFYEQRLIQQALVARTGQRFLDGQTSDEQLFKHLMDNAIQSKQQLDLALGISLTSAQVAALTHDIVWLENAEVNGEQVLVPVLYLANANHRLAANGALIAGSDVNLIAGQQLDNVGTLRASNSLSAQAGGNLVNSGLVEAGKRLDLQAGNDLVNKAGGIIAGRDVSLTATQDVLNERTLTSHQSSNGSYAQQRDFVDNAARVEATNNLVVNAGRDVLNRGGALASGGDTHIKADRDVSLSSVAQRVSNDHGVRHNNSSVTQNGSSVQAGQDLTISAGRDVTAIASQVEVKRDLAMTAVGDLSLVSAANEQHSATKTRKVTAQDDRVTQVASTVTAGGNLNLRAGEDLTLVASQAKAGKEAYLYAGNDVELLAAHDESYSYYKKKKEGSFGKSSMRMTESASSIAVSSLVEGAQGVDLVAKRDVNVQVCR
ncbi:filamentous hemagglutinin N-terminal domain-containing protein [Pseudomonas sp. NPDC089554]|uniref:two-partner secretion domain-containing protein n=1 Tax=Pseudomonas sp. NPDC089554 TaxID=3390653 RepID=UPI003D051FA7